MKKRIKLFISLFLILLVITGCTFSKDRNKVIKQLKKHDVINKKWDLVVETSTTTADLFIDTVSYDYIYETKDDTYNVVRIMDNEKKYTIEVQYDVYYYTTKEKSKNSDGSEKEYTAHHFESPRKIVTYYLNPDEKSSLFTWKMEKLNEEELDNKTTTIKITNTENFEYHLSDDIVAITIEEETNSSGRKDIKINLRSLKEGDATLTTSHLLASGRTVTYKFKIKVNERLDIIYEQEPVTN